MQIKAEVNRKRKKEREKEREKGNENFSTFWLQQTGRWTRPQWVQITVINLG